MLVLPINLVMTVAALVCAVRATSPPALRASVVAVVTTSIALVSDMMVVAALWVSSITFE
jgi:multisubunit Na+/H+ antiporter MnhF subunit